MLHSGSVSTLSERKPFQAMELELESDCERDTSCRGRIRQRKFKTSSPRLRRAIVAMAFILLFSLLMIFREGKEEESILHMENQMEEEQEKDDVDVARHHSKDFSTNADRIIDATDYDKQPTFGKTETATTRKPQFAPSASKSTPVPSKAGVEQESSFPPQIDDRTEVKKPETSNNVRNTEIPVDAATNTPQSGPQNDEESKSNSAQKEEPNPLDQPEPHQPIISRPKQQEYQTQAPFDPNAPLQGPILPLDTSNDQAFVQRYCDLQGSDWFPSEKEEVSNKNITKGKSWHLRAPFIMLVGPSHSGSDELFQLLQTHPQVADAMTSHFFTYNYKFYVKELPSTGAADSESGNRNSLVRIKTRAAREAYMARHISAQRHIQKNPSQIIVDSVPDTLLYSQKFAPFAMCVMPWVKLVVSVSHPIQRLLRHYQAAQKHGLRLSLEDWVARDLERMQDAGVLQGAKEPAKEVLDHAAWVEYQQLTTTAMEASAGQSMYEYIAHPWFTVMEEMGRNPTTEIHVVQREVLIPAASNNSTTPEERLVQEYQRILKRLGLTKHTPPSTIVKQLVAQQKADLASWKKQLDDGLRKQLKQFFTPYNVFFDQFLKSYYGQDGRGTGAVARSKEKFLNWDPDLWKS